MGDFYSCWWNILAKLDKIQTNLSESLRNAMERRGKLLFQNHIFAAGMTLIIMYLIFKILEYYY